LILDAPANQVTVALAGVRSFDATVNKFELTSAIAPLELSYDIASSPLDFTVDLDSTTSQKLFRTPYLRTITGTISNPEPGSLSVHPENDGSNSSLYLTYKAVKRITELALAVKTTRLALDAELHDIPDSVKLCAYGADPQAGASSSGPATRAAQHLDTCEPSYVQTDDPHLIPSYALVTSSSGTTGSGDPDQPQLSIDGSLCTIPAGAASCSPGQRGDPSFSFTGVKSTAIEFALGFPTTESLPFGIKLPWVSLTTPPQQSAALTDFKFYDSGGGDPLVELKAPNGMTATGFLYDPGENKAGTVFAADNGGILSRTGTICVHDPVRADARLAGIEINLWKYAKPVANQLLCGH